MTQQCGSAPPPLSLSVPPPPLSSPPQCWCRPTIVFWCFLRPTIGLHSQQPKQTFVNLYASGHKRGVWGGGGLLLSSACTFPLRCPFLSCSSALTNINPAPGSERQRPPSFWKWCHMWLPLFIKLTQAQLRCRPFPAFGPAHYSQYLHAILNCWEFPWWREPPLHEIFRARRDSREAQRRVFTPIWLYDMIFSWAMTVLLN